MHDKEVLLARDAHAAVEEQHPLCEPARAPPARLTTPGNATAALSSAASASARHALGEVHQIASAVMQPGEATQARAAAHS